MLHFSLFVSQKFNLRFHAERGKTLASATETLEVFIHCCHSFIHLANIQRAPTQCQTLGTKRRIRPRPSPCVGSARLGDALRRVRMLSALQSASFCVYNPLTCRCTIKTAEPGVPGSKLTLPRRAMLFHLRCFAPQPSCIQLCARLMLKSWRLQRFCLADGCCQQLRSDILVLGSPVMRNFSNKITNTFPTTSQSLGCGD